MNELEHYINEIFDFEKNQDTASYTERTGPPQELPAVIGMIAMNFQCLETEVSKRIIQMIQLEKDIGEIITAELSFRNKIHLFASLHYKLKDKYHFNSLPGFEEGYFKALLKALTKCEELRNQVLHSEIILNWKTKEINRKKITAKSSKGLNKINEKVNIPYLFNIADYIISISMEVDQFFIDFKKINAT